VSEAWSGERAERHLRSLELFGMRFGLDRMRRMMTALGSPERRFRSIHVVGTNGKSSTTRMTAAILRRHGLRTGAYLSPHLVSYTERVQVDERDLPMNAFAAAVAHAARAAERVNRTLAEDDHVTQFELLTAAAFWALAEHDVEVAVIEAGLGGRYDATAVIESSVAVLCGVGLEHTRWLGPTVRDIAAEKLAVVRPGSTLALGADLDADALEVARVVAGERGARIVTAPDADAAAVSLRGAFQRRNFALARVAAQAYLANAGIALDEQAVRDAASTIAVAGRLQVLGGDPLTVLDGAHNPDAVAALVQALPEVLAAPAPEISQVPIGEPSPGAVGARALGLVLGVLDDKDAASMLRGLLPLCTRAWFTAPPSPRALSPAALESLARQLGFEAAVCEPQPRRALARAREWARAFAGAGEPAAVLATGSVYLVGDLLADVGESVSAARGESASAARRESLQESAPAPLGTSSKGLGGRLT
jgi:dihydrofolate synthase / folylpolyglutamate synthase